MKGTLESIARADRPLRTDVRVIVVNNDESAELPGLQPVLRAMPFHTQVLHEPTPGKSSALNTAAMISDADYLGLIDDDEEIESRWFRVVEDALQNGAFDFIGGRSLPLWSRAAPDWIPPDYPAVLGITDMGPEARRYGPNSPGMLCGGNAVIARTTLHRVGLLCSTLGPRAHRRLFSGEDEDLYWRLIDAGARGLYVPELIVYHQIHPERLTKRYYRAWAFWNGASKGVLSHRRRTSFPTIAAVPRYLYGEAARGLLKWARLAFRRGSAGERFSAELSLWHLAGHLYGRHWPAHASGSSPVPGTPAPRNTSMARR